MRSFAAITALSAVALAAPVAEPEPITLPITRNQLLTRDDGTADMPAILASLNRTLAKYNKKPLPYYPAIAAAQQQAGLLGSVSGVLGGLKKRATANEALTDQVEDGYIDELYYGPSVIGSGDGKPQTFTLDFDTGSADLFIPGPACTTADGCTGTTRYDQGGKDQHRTTSVTYGSGQISGEDYSDDVSVAGLKVTNQTLISLTTATGFSGSASDGLMGMGFQSIAQTGSPPYFANLISQGVVTNKEFAFYLGRAQSKTQGASELTLGGRDTSKFSGTPTQVAVTTPGYWQVALDSVKVNGKSAGPTTQGQAAIDTGTTLILAPTIAAGAIFLNIPGSFPIPMGEETFFAYPCNTNKKYVPTITFAGQNFAVNPLDFNFGTLTNVFGIQLGNNTLANILGDALNTYCVAGIVGGDIDPTENLYVVGDAFLKNWYAIFSYVANGGKPAVSFAKAVGNQ